MLVLEGLVDLHRTVQPQLLLRSSIRTEAKVLVAIFTSASKLFACIQLKDTYIYICHAVSEVIGITVSTH